MIETQGIPLIRTKLMIPAIRERMVHRSSLINRIEKGIEQGFILVSSPPGYGKTTLIADWAQQSPMPVAWLTLDEHDNDLATLCRYLSAIIDKFIPFDGSDTGVLFPEETIEENFSALLVALINGCAEMKSDFTLVLDDYHVIQNQKIHDGLMFLLDHFPSHLRLILATRSDPPFAIARLRANDHILELTEQDLVFNLEETDQFLHQTVQLHPSKTEVEHFFTRTEGWVTGLQLASLAANESNPEQSAELTISSQAYLTLDYMIEEVLSHQPPQIQDFLLRTSILENLYGPLCDYILSAQGTQLDSQELLHSLYHANLFLTALDDNEHWFRYHALFADALRHLLAEKYPAEIPVLYDRASAWCDQNGFFEEALAYASAGEDGPRTVALLEKYSGQAIINGNLLDILNRIQNVDETLFFSSPVLSIMCALGYLVSLDLDLAEIWLEKARSLMGEADAAQKLDGHENEYWGVISAIQSILSAARGDSEGAIALSSHALTLLTEGNTYLHSFALIDQGLAFSLNGEMDKAIAILQETVHFSQKSGNWAAMMFARSNLGELWIARGELSQALTLFRQSLTYISNKSSRFSWFEGFLYIEMANIFMARNQLAEAGQCLRQSVALNNKESAFIRDLDMHVCLAHLYHSQGDFRRSEDEMVLARQLSNASQSRLDDFIVDLNESRFALLKGQTAQAQRWAQKNGLSGKVTFKNLEGVPFIASIDAQMVLVRLYLAQGRQAKDRGKFSQALEALNQVTPVLLNSGLVEYQIEANILLALTYHELEKGDDELAALKQALVLAEPEEFRQVFLDEGVPMARLLTHYLSFMKQNKISDVTPTRAYISDLLFRLTGKENESDKRELAPVIDQDENVFLVELLTAREAEVLQLVARGRSNNEIALDLHISVNTVKRHLNNTFTKLGVSTRIQAVRVASQQGLIH